MDWQARFENEIQKAGLARRGGNEGRARVCARRAAGIVAGEYLERRGLAPAKTSAIDVLAQLRSLPSCPADVLALIEDFVRPVNAAFQLPPGMDLIAEAQSLRRVLLPD